VAVVEVRVGRTKALREQSRSASFRPGGRPQQRSSPAVRIPSQRRRVRPNRLAQHDRVLNLVLVTLSSSQSVSGTDRVDSGCLSRLSVCLSFPPRVPVIRVSILSSSVLFVDVCWLMGHCWRGGGKSVNSEVCCSSIGINVIIVLCLLCCVWRGEDVVCTCMSTARGTPPVVRHTNTETIQAQFRSHT
jgi:hypothetical protein